MSFGSVEGFAAPPNATPDLEHWFAQIQAEIESIAGDLVLPLAPTSGGTGLETYATGDVLYADAADSLAALPIGAEGELLKVSAGGLPVWGASSVGDADTVDGYHATDLFDMTHADISGRLNVGDHLSSGLADEILMTRSVGGVQWDTLLSSDLPSHTHAVGDITGAGDLTKSDDANVTLTLGGTPAGALLNGVSLTLGWSSTLGLSRGGTSADLSADADLPVAPEQAVVTINDGGFDVLANPGEDRFLKFNAAGSISWASVPGTVPDSDASGRLLIGDGSSGWTNSAWAVTSEEPVNAEFLRHPGGLNQTATWEAIQSSDLPPHSHAAENITSGSFGGASPGGGYTFSTAVTMQSTLDVTGAITGDSTVGTSGDRFATIYGVDLDLDGSLEISPSDTSGFLARFERTATSITDGLSLGSFQIRGTDDGSGIGALLIWRANGAWSGSTGSRPTDFEMWVHHGSGFHTAILNKDGNFTLDGGNFFDSSSIEKKDVQGPWQGDALEIIRNTDLWEYYYKSDSKGLRKVGFIAEDAHPMLVDDTRKFADLHNVIALSLAGIQQLDDRVTALEEKVA